MSVSSTKYVVISPVRDEEAYIRFTVDCMAQQTIVPKEWVLINDGSSDKTGDILDEYARRYPWIRVVHRANRGFRKAGGGVVEAFNAGYNALEFRDWDFLVKLDGDLSFEPDYFEKCFQNFEKEPRLGVGGGVICYITNGVKEFEPSPAFHVRGATKIYKRACWDAIGGFWPAPGWDTMDEVKANMLGWTTRSFLDLHIVHFRRTGTADGQWAGLVKNGRANYICGYHPLFMISKCIRRLVKKPYLIGAIGLFYGFLSGYWKRIPQVDDLKTISYLRRQQLGRLLGLETIWR
ncbi:MAG TPA: glycosyltransferase family 2 protein [Verrucomicrobiae bacterium]|nr:glycosyltransferase family 2 protein [Verrucomicrobiae bacterium]